jgi:hypothetical protein
VLTVGTVAGGFVLLVVACNAIVGNQDAFLRPDARSDATSGREAGIEAGKEASDASSHESQCGDACGPVTLTYVEGSCPQFITADNLGSVYWTTLTSILTCPTSGCDAGRVLEMPGDQVAEAPILYEPEPPGRGRLLWGQVRASLETSIDRASTDGGAVSVLVKDAGQYVYTQALDGTRLVWCAGNSSPSTVWTCDLDASCASPTKLATPNNCRSVTTDSKNVYWTDVYDDNGSVDWCSLPDCDGGGTLASGLMLLNGILYAKGSLYFGVQTTQTGTTINILSLPVGGDGGAPKLFASDVGLVARLAADDTNLYWTGNEIGWCPLDDCHEAGTLARLTTGWVFYDLAVDSENVYWTLDSISGVCEGSIVKIAKP